MNDERRKKELEKILELIDHKKTYIEFMDKMHKAEKLRIINQIGAIIIAFLLLFIFTKISPGIIKHIANTIFLVLAIVGFVSLADLIFTLICTIRFKVYTKK